MYFVFAVFSFILTIQEETDLRKSVPVWLLSYYPKPGPWGADSPRPERFGLMRKPDMRLNCCSRDRNNVSKSFLPGTSLQVRGEDESEAPEEGACCFLAVLLLGPQSSASSGLQNFQRVGVLLSISCLRGDPGRRFLGYATESRFCQRRSIKS